jgi:predicted NBD/HSP70 family sugar kinase
MPIRETTRALERARIPKSRVLGAGIGIPGPIDSRSGYVTPSSVSPVGWESMRAQSSKSFWAFRA